MPSRLWCPDCAFWVGEIGPYSGAADDDPYVSIYDTEKQLLHLGLPSRYQEAMDQGALSDRLLAAFDGLSAQLQAAARFVLDHQIGRAHVELQSLMRISYAVFCLKKKTTSHQHTHNKNIEHKP